ncbi:MAG: acyl--CoA ligase [Chloroflexi bacterium]|nr:MAG: acyl--CoA ligase [Chloroflexota bacterium]
MQSHPLLPAELQARYRAEGLWSDDTFFSLLETSAAAAADRPLYLEPEVRTYGEATAAARALAQHLVASGVKPGDGVVTPLVNGLPAAVVSAAVAGAGGRLAPLPSRAHPAQAISLAATLEAPVLIVSGEVLARGEWDAGVLDRIRRESPSVRLILLADAGAAPDWARERLPTLESAVAANAAAELPPVDAGAIALLLSTGGTTGPAKVVMHTYAGPVFAAREYARIARLTAEDRVVQVGPFGHASGTIFTLYPPVMAGAAVVPLVGWDPVAFASAVESAEATWTHLSGTHVHDLLALDPVHDAKLRSLRGISAGSGSDQLFREAERRFGFQIQRIYGLTECLGNSLVPAGAPDDRRLHCDGRGFDGIEYRVVSPGTDDPLPPGTPGEMFVRGPSLFAGYLGRPEATAEVVRDDGFLATGDLTCSPTPRSTTSPSSAYRTVGSASGPRRSSSRRAGRSRSSPTSPASSPSARCRSDRGRSCSTSSTRCPSPSTESTTRTPFGGWSPSSSRGEAESPRRGRRPPSPRHLLGPAAAGRAHRSGRRGGGAWGEPGADPGGADRARPGGPCRHRAPPRRLRLVLRA